MQLPLLPLLLLNLLLLLCDSISSDISRILTARLMCNAQLEKPKQPWPGWQPWLVGNSISAVAGSRLSWLRQNGVALSLSAFYFPNWFASLPPSPLPTLTFTPFPLLPSATPSARSRLTKAIGNRHSDLDSFSTRVEPQMSRTTSATWDSQSVLPHPLLLLLRLLLLIFLLHLSGTHYAIIIFFCLLTINIPMNIFDNICINLLAQVKRANAPNESDSDSDSFVHKQMGV